MALPAFPPATTPSSATVSVTVPNLTMPPLTDVTPPPSPPSPPPETISSSPPPLASPSSSLHPESSPPPPPLSSPPATLPLPPPLPQIPPVSDITPPPLPPIDPSPLPPLVSPPSPPTTDVPLLPSPTTTRSQPPSLPKKPSPSTPAIINNPPPRHSTPSPISSPTKNTPITNSPPRHHRTRTLPSTDPKTPTTTPSPSRSSHSGPRTPRNSETNLQPQEPKTRVHEHPPFPPVQASSPDAYADQSSPPPGNIPESEMPLFPHSSAPGPGQPLLPGGGGGGGAVIGSQPASSVLPIGVDMGPDLAGRGGGKSSSSSTARVPAGVVVGLGVGGVILVLLLVFGILVVFFRRKRGFSFSGGGFGICKRDTEGGKSSLPRYSKQNRTSEDRLIWGNTSTSIPRQQQAQPSVVTNQAATSSVNLRNSALDSNNQAMAMAMGAFSVGSSFTYEELSAATGGFSDSNLLGQGGFGYVYKGVLPNGKEVAVKQLKLGGHQGEREFQAEVETISQVHHKHLVSLVGYCIAGAERLLVYDFVPNNTLDFHLHGKDQEVMPWSRRLKIAIGSGKGLAYLHEDCNPTIIHRDIKAANILLDINCEAKVSDFGLAKIFSNTSDSDIVTHITTRVVGTFGYLAPEYASSGKVTDKSDVYSYGVMLLELITGRPPINHTAGSEEMNGSLVNWARPLLAQAIEEGDFQTLADPRLEKNYNQNEMASMVACAAACIRLSAWRRPRMCQVVRALEGDLSPSNLDDGVRPGQSSTHYSYESSLDFDARKYMEEMKRFKMELASSGGDSINNMTNHHQQLQ